MNWFPVFFIVIFLIGECIVNAIYFPYLKKYFDVQTSEKTQSKKIFRIEISIFKGILERFLIYFALTIGLSQILIAYGALKIGTRFEKDDKIKNDYFLIGNFSSILFSIFYYFILKRFF